MANRNSSSPVECLPVGRVCGVYKITSPSGRFYIGSSVDVRKRWAEHRCRLSGKAGVHHNQYLQNAVNKYGLESIVFELIEQCERDIVREREQFYIDTLKPQYNLSTKVESLLAELWTQPEFRANNSAKASSQNRRNWADPEYRERAKGRVDAMNTPVVRIRAVQAKADALVASPEMRKKLSRVSSENMKAMHQRPGFRDALVERQRAALTAIRSDPEMRLKNHLASSKANSKPIRLLNTGQEFEGVGQAAKAMGISIGVLKKQLFGMPTRTGYRWQFIPKGADK